MSKFHLLLVNALLVTCFIGVAKAAPIHPNIIFILTDDMREDDIAYMPNVNSLLANHGTEFHNHFCNVSLCCPSRATTLRGQYSHNTNVTSNSGPNGGFSAFNAQGLENSTIATWLQSAGYRTVLIGKYLNGYSGTTAQDIPPGWSEWYVGNTDKCYQNFNYTLNENGTVVSYGGAPADYGTDVYSKKAVDFIQRAAAAPIPFFVYVAPYSPHSPANAAPRDVGAHNGAQAPRSINFNEADVSDKPADIRVLPLLTPKQITALDTLYAKRLDSLLSIDKMVGDIIKTLRTAGQLSNTYIVFTSDNGFHLGNHRTEPGKWTPYEEDTPLPLVIRGPGVPTRKVEYITGNVDFAPTFAEIAGVAIPDFVDGRSLVPLFSDPLPPEGSWRHAFLVEHAPVSATSPSYPCTEYAGLHTKVYDYVEYHNGDRELYDLSKDPYQVSNQYGKIPYLNVEAVLAARLSQMRTGGGASFRAIEQMLLLVP